VVVGVVMAMKILNHLSESVLSPYSSANLGISLDENYRFICQNRSHHVTSASATQWRMLDSWLTQHAAELCALLDGTRFTLFGEWMYAKHSIHYTRLPSYLVAFDLYDRRQRRFLSVCERNRLFSEHAPSIAVVRQLNNNNRFNVDQLRQLLSTQRSHYYDGPVEGLYLRIDSGNWLQQRAKVVRADFLLSGGGGDEDSSSSSSNVEHWSKREVIKNIVQF
jgi:hypothetical protein